MLAFQTFKSPTRADNLGWSRLHAFFQDGGGKAYTISSVLVLRAAMWATKTTVSWKVSVSDGQPYMLGDRNSDIGHFFLDDRVGLVIKGDTKIHMDRCRKIDLAWGPEEPPEWQIHIGDERIWEDPAQRALGKIERMLAGLHDLGVYTMLGVLGTLAATAVLFGGDPELVTASALALPAACGRQRSRRCAYKAGKAGFRSRARRYFRR
ncbi:MAG: hypothetical protein K0U84_18410 [Actinomycetia bacterium]|nr:hypothetical protein [Actinomycetes bacterium]